MEKSNVTEEKVKKEGDEVISDSIVQIFYEKFVNCLTNISKSHNECAICGRSMDDVKEDN